MEPLLFILFGVIALVAIIYGLYAADRRRKLLAAWAASRGLSFARGKVRSFDNRRPMFDCLKRGHDRYAYNVMRGDWGGRAILAFDYHYATGSGKNRSDYHFSAVIVRSAVPLQPLFIRPEGMFDRVTEFFGFDDIDFESAEFSRRFYVKAQDRKWAYDVLHQRAMEFLLARPRHTIQMGVTEVLATTDKQLESAGFEAVLALVTGLLDLLPEYVVRQQMDTSETHQA